MSCEDLAWVTRQLIVINRAPGWTFSCVLHTSKCLKETSIGMCTPAIHSAAFHQQCLQTAAAVRITGAREDVKQWLCSSREVLSRGCPVHCDPACTTPYQALQSKVCAPLEHTGFHEVQAEYLICDLQASPNCLGAGSRVQLVNCRRS